MVTHGCTNQVEASKGALGGGWDFVGGRGLGVQALLVPKDTCQFVFVKHESRTMTPPHPPESNTCNER